MPDTSSSLTVQAVVSVQHTFWQALQAKDRVLFEQCLAREYVARSPEIRQQERDAFVALLCAFPGQIHHVFGEDIEVLLVGTAAVLTGIQWAEIEWPSGQTIQQALALSNVFVEKDGGVQMVLSYTVDITDDESSLRAA